MTVEVVTLDVVVVVLPVPGARVVGRVDVDRIDTAAVRVRQRLENVEVFTVDDSVEGLVTAFLYRSGGAQTGVDAVAELSDEHKLVDGDFDCLRLLASGKG